MTMYNVYIQQDRLEHYKPRHATTKFKRHVSSHQRRCDQIVTRATSEEIDHPEIARFAIAVVAFRGSCMHSQDFHVRIAKVLIRGFHRGHGRKA